MWQNCAEEDCARSLKENKNLKLADGEEFVVLLHTEQALKDPHAFYFKSYLDSLSTRRFGEFHIWSPRLPSTHDLVSQLVYCALQKKFIQKEEVSWNIRILMENGHILPLLHYVVSLAIIETIKMVYGSKDDDGPFTERVVAHPSFSSFRFNDRVVAFVDHEGLSEIKFESLSLIV
ncbi:hypothetical protein QJS10_CPA03g01903 [Acorus calamus]|uniref:Uncharacterized protein n=1 Tax=Acorus calamus TaxID=4465 RepID=A0AAV9F9Z4_ACOCL|nr:hypothetical protein QJS10_CPA03g01903 [Acorus calamus]